MKYTRFQDIPPFTRTSAYQVDVAWDSIERMLEMFGTFDLDPDFQRAHVWDDEKRVRYVEFVLRGGRSANTILWNCPTWQRMNGFKEDQPVVLVDGKQRLEAARRFMANELLAFGSYRREFTDSMRMTHQRFQFHVNDLATRAEVLQWFIEINSNMVAHTPEEIARVRALLEAEKSIVSTPPRMK